jgi:hypothetical protein
VATTSYYTSKSRIAEVVAYGVVLCLWVQAIGRNYELAVFRVGCFHCLPEVLSRIAVELLKFGRGGIAW